jgi:uncharacterized protein (TIGR00730 family)
MQSICIFCGANPGFAPSHIELARSVGRLVASRGLRLIYGGGRVGLMGAMADAALSTGGEVIGVIPQLLLDREVGHGGLTQLHVVTTMAQRKALMGELSDAFLTLPGGIGTMDEFFEAWTWTQLGLQHKPSGLLNADGYYDPLLEFLDRSVAAGFLHPASRASVLIDTSPERLLDQLAAWSPGSAAVRPA